MISKDLSGIPIINQQGFLKKKFNAEINQISNDILVRFEIVNICYVTTVLFKELKKGFILDIPISLCRLLKREFKQNK